MKFQFYIASAIGAAIAGFIDQIKNGNGADVASFSGVTIFRIQAALRQISQVLDSAACAYVLLMVVGLILCWVSSPSTRKEALILGLSVFSIFAISAPYEVQKPALPTPASGAPPVTKSGAADIFLNWVVPPALAGDPAPPVQTGIYYFTFVPEDGADASSQLLVSIYRRSDGTLISRQAVSSKVPMRLKLEYGYYYAIVEGQGYDRSRMNFLTEKPLDGAEFNLSGNGWPLSLQRLAAPSDIAGRDLSSVEVQSLEKAALNKP